jgi:hypothetical protein
VEADISTWRKTGHFYFALTTPSCKSLRLIAMLRHDAALNESVCKVAKADIRTGA